MPYAGPAAPVVLLSLLGGPENRENSHSKVGLSKTHWEGGDLYLSWSRGEAERFLFARFEMPARPDLSVIAASGLGAPQVNSP